MKQPVQETNPSTQQPEPKEPEANKKLRTGLKIRTRIVAGDGDYAIPMGNHGLRLRTSF